MKVTGPETQVNFGFAGIFVNVEGREGKGIVPADEREEVVAEIRRKREEEERQSAKPQETPEPAAAPASAAVRKISSSSAALLGTSTIPLGSNIQATAPGSAILPPS